MSIWLRYKGLRLLKRFIQIKLYTEKIQKYIKMDK